jgi:hypothetical protein
LVYARKKTLKNSPPKILLLGDYVIKVRVPSEVAGVVAFAPSQAPVIDICVGHEAWRALHFVSCAPGPSALSTEWTSSPVSVPLRSADVTLRLVTGDVLL